MDRMDTRDYLYAVLNLPSTASQNEIRERYRTLSVIFHPDKQHDERTKDTAAVKFLEIQKAYEVLSDPFLRHVYDRLGPEGLKWNWSADLRSKDNEEIKAAFDEWEFDRRHETIEKLLQPRGSVTCSINASSLFASGGGASTRNFRNVVKRIHGIGVTSFGVRQSVTKRLGPKTTVALTGHSQTGAKNITRTLTGTFQHQFSPRFALELTAGFLKPHIVAAATSYNDSNNAIALRTGFIPALWRTLPPFFTLSVGRRLFRHSPTQGSATWTVSPGSSGRLELHVHSSKPFDLTLPDEYTPAPEPSEPMFDNGPGSISGFGAGVGSWSCGMILSGAESCFTVNYSVFLHELALRLKAAMEIGLLGVSYSVSAKWSGKRSDFSTTAGVGNWGVFVRFELSYLRQKWTLPIVLSPENNDNLALYSVIIPSTALALGYHFVLKPRRNAQRARYFDIARRALKEEKSAVIRQTENTTLLLREPARRHMDAEKAIGGLVILEAAYGPTVVSDETAGLDIDVTIPLQALVHKSQLYVSNRVPKSGIQGFCDPAPRAPKSLRVRYMFRDQMHYAEIPDLLPIVLPLRDHLVA